MTGDSERVRRGGAENHAEGVRSGLRLLAVAAVMLFVASSGTAATNVSSSGEATLALGDATETIGETVVVDLTVTGSNVAGYQANVTYDPTLVQFESASGVDFSDPISNADDDAGWVALTQSRTTGIDGPVVVRLSFTVTAVGTTPLELTDKSVVNTAVPTVLPTEREAGSVTGERSADRTSQSDDSSGAAGGPTGGNGGDGGAAGDSDQGIESETGGAVEPSDTPPTTTSDETTRSTTKVRTESLDSMNTGSMSASATPDDRVSPVEAKAIGEPPSTQLTARRTQTPDAMTGFRNRLGVIGPVIAIVSALMVLVRWTRL